MRGVCFDAMVSPSSKVFATLLAPLLACATPEPATADPWAAALSLDYNGAAAGFAAAHASAPDDPRLGLAHAASLLIRQPRREANILRARELAESAAALSPATAGDLPLAARYLLARIYHDHLTTPRPDRARELYEALRSEHPGTVWADRAIMQLALLATFAPDLDSLPRLETLLTEVASAPARAELLWLIGRARLAAGHTPAAVLDAWLPARAIGFTSPLRDAELDLSIASLATEAERPDLAREHYRSFLSAHPRDPRAATVAVRLEALPTP